MGWGEAFGKASNSFIDTYTKLQQNSRANEEAERLKVAQAIQEQLQREKMKELENQGLMRSEVQSVLDQISKPMEVVDPTTGKKEKVLYDNMNSYWEANKKDPYEEMMKLLFPVIAKYDPLEAVKIFGKQDIDRDKLAQLLTISQMNNAGRKEVAEIRISNNPMMSEGGQAQIDILAKGVIDGTIDPNGISKRGYLQQNVWSRVKELKPDFNIVKAGAGAAFEKNPGAMQTKALLNSIDPLLDNLLTAHKEITDTGSPLLNIPIHAAQKNILPDKMGGVEVSAFDNLRNDTIAEIERGLLNTGVLSDFKYQLGLKNLKSAQTHKQMEAAVNNIRKVIKARLEALEAGPYPNEQITTQEKPSSKTTVRYDAKGNRIK